MEIPLAPHIGAQPVEPGGHIAGGAVGPFLGCLDAEHALAGQRLANASHGVALVLANQRFDHVVSERSVFEQPADHVEHLVGVEFPADRFELFEQHL